MIYLICTSILAVIVSHYKANIRKSDRAFAKLLGEVGRLSAELTELKRLGWEYLIALAVDAQGDNQVSNDKLAAAKIGFRKALGEPPQREPDPRIAVFNKLVAGFLPEEEPQ